MFSQHKLDVKISASQQLTPCDMWTMAMGGGSRKVVKPITIARLKMEGACN